MNSPKLIRVRDVMRADFDTVDGMDTVKSALDKMVHLDTRSLIVKKRSEHDAYGLVTMSDIAKRVLAVDRPVDRVNIYEVMSKPVISVDPGMDIRYCARLFSAQRLSRAPVIEDNIVIGIVSFNDMVVKGMRYQ